MFYICTWSDASQPSADVDTLLDQLGWSHGDKQHTEGWISPQHASQSEVKQSGTDTGQFTSKDQHQVVEMRDKTAKQEEPVIKDEVKS